MNRQQNDFRKSTKGEITNKKEHTHKTKDRVTGTQLVNYNLFITFIYRNKTI